MGLSANGLSVDYGRTRVIDGLALAPVQPGQLLALVGPNGAGKSTLLKALAGLVPARGQVQLQGQDLSKFSGPQRAARVGYMPQALPDDLALSVLDGMLSILRATEGGGTADPVPRCHACLQGLGIAHLALKPLSDLSGGQRQMASLAQALVRAPEVLLLDEPTSALDLRYQAQVMGAVRAYAQGPRLAVVVLHDLALAARWADRIAVLHGGRLRADGAPGAVFTPALLAEVYGVRARVEACSQGGLQVLVDGVA